MLILHPGRFYIPGGLRGKFGVMPNCLEPQSQRPSRSGIKVWPEALKRVSDFRRRGAHCPSVDDTVLFQFTELRGENFFADASQKIAEFGEAQRAKKTVAILPGLSICRSGH
jgi:hypothetical protein